MHKRPTIQMIAERAGVSRGTVDRVLNNRSYVSADARERILSVMEEVGYVPRTSVHAGTGAITGDAAAGSAAGAALTGTIAGSIAAGASPGGAAAGTAAIRAGVPVLKLGVLLPDNFGGQFKTDVEEGIAMASEELAYSNIEVIVKRCTTDIPRETITLLGELEAEGAAGISICALNDESIQKKVTELTDSGIPCVTFNNDLAGSGRLCFVGPDIRREGRVAAGLMSRCVEPGDMVLAAVGNLKFDGHFQRLSGFLERMGELGFREEQLITEETFNDYGTTCRVVKEAFARHPEIRGVYMANLSVSGCVEAIRGLGLPEHIHIVCHDINEGIRQLLLDGSVDFTIPQDMVMQSYRPLMILRDYLQKGTMPGSLRSFGKIPILCAENLE